MIRVGPDVKGSGTVDDPWIPLSAQKRYGALVSPRVSAPDSSARKQFEEWQKSLPPCALVTGKTPAAPTTRSTTAPASVATKRIGGCAVPFSMSADPYRDHEPLYEIGCFDESLRSGSEVRILMEHDETRCIGSNFTGELRLKADYFGLNYEAVLDVELAEILVRRGYRVSVGTSTKRSDKDIVVLAGRYVEKHKISRLEEISFTLSPRFGGTKVKFL